MRRKRKCHQQQELEAIFCLHADGLKHFERENVEASRECFHSSFAAITRLLRETRNRDALYYRGSPVVRESEFSPVFILSSQQHSDGVHDIETKTSVFALTSSSFVASGDLPLYLRALHIPKLVTIDQFVFVALYNLALSTHLSALSQATQAKQETLMRRAAKQWGLVYALHGREGLQLQPPHGLAILLNLGHATALTGNESGSRACYQNILSAIHILDSRKYAIPNKAHFLYSAFCMLGGKSTVGTAPAA